VVEHPPGEQRAASADDARDAILYQRQMLFQDACVNGEEVHTLFGLRFNDVEDYLFVYFIHVSAFYDLIYRYGAEGYGAMGQQLLSGAIEIAARAKVHYGVGADVQGRIHFLDFRLHRGTNGAGADIGVYFGRENSADTDRFQVGLKVESVGRYYDVSAGNFLADKRIELARALMGQLGLDPWRLRFEYIGAPMQSKLMDVLQKMEERIRQLGPNPAAAGIR